MPGRVGALHRDTLRERLVAVCTHAPIGIFACQVHACFQPDSTLRGERSAGIEKPVEALPGAGAAASRRKFYVANLRSPFRTRSVKANGKSIEQVVGMDEDYLAGLLSEHAADLIAEVQSAVNPVGQPCAGRYGIVALVSGQRTEIGRTSRVARLERRVGVGCMLHERRKIPRPVAELLIQPYVLRT